MLFLALYGLLIGIVVKMIFPGDKEPAGFIGSVAIGIVGSYVGGILNYLIFGKGSVFQTSGVLFSIIGGLLCCLIWVNKDKIIAYINGLRNR